MPQFQDITELFRQQKQQNNYLSVAAPMVRYSKLEFRRLLRQNDVKLCFTPMIIADSFIRSQEARLNEFTTNTEDRPLIAQFAARTNVEMLAASELISPYVDGVDLNCGCPQSWAISKGIGCALLRKPETLRDIIHTLRRNLPSKFSCSFKLRLLQEDITSTIELCRQLEKCGATFLVIHGRTQWQKISHPLDIAAMAEIKKSIQIPLVVNGDVRTLEDADELYEQTKADGVMSARGLLANPGLFTGSQQTTEDCLQQWLDIAHAAGDDISFQCFHHHLTFMWGKLMHRRRRVQFNNFSSKAQVYAFFDELYGIRPNTRISHIPKTVCLYDDRVIANHQLHIGAETCLNKSSPHSWSSAQDGKLFTTFKKKSADDNDENDLFFQNGSIFDV